MRLADDGQSRLQRKIRRAVGASVIYQDDLNGVRERISELIDSGDCNVHPPGFLPGGNDNRKQHGCTFYLVLAIVDEKVLF